MNRLPRSIPVEANTRKGFFTYIELLDRETQDMRAAEAVEVFCSYVKKWIGAFAAALGGLGTLVLTGGIGVNAPTGSRSDLRWARIFWNRTRRKGKRGELGGDFRGNR